MANTFPLNSVDLIQVTLGASSDEIFITGHAAAYLEFAEDLFKRHTAAGVGFTLSLFKFFD